MVEQVLSKRVAVWMGGAVGEVDDFVAKNFRVAGEDVERRKAAEGSAEDGRAERMGELVVGGVQLDLLAQLDGFLRGVGALDRDGFGPE